MVNVRFIPSLDVFNVSNSNTIQAIRGTQNATATAPERESDPGHRGAARRPLRRPRELVGESVEEADGARSSAAVAVR